MYISLNWINDFINIPSKIKADKIAEELTSHTVEVEGFSSQEEMFNKVVVGEVLEVKKHPNADRLNLAKVKVGEEELHIVCGAPNLASGQKVAVAKVGAVLPNGMEMKAAEIRGEKSFGMICAEDELGLGKDHEGILVLNKEAKVGQDFSKYLKYNDIILEIDNKSLSNRPDLLNHYGIARELSAIFDLKLKPYSDFFDNKISFEKEKKLKVKVTEKELCPRYMALKFSNVKIQESPQWIKERLIAVGQNPINNIVDISNYIMIELGQPLHTFDANKVDEIIVRRAKKDEKIESLDGKERILKESDLVIADSSKAIAIAGVIGGQNSEIDNDSTEIILEAANFQAVSIRKTSQHLGLRTEASTRYEKSLDANLTEQAVYRFIALLKKVCPEAKIDSDLVDINNVKEEKKIIKLNLQWLNDKIGTEIPKKQTINYLNKLGFGVEAQDDELTVEVPSWRATKDISIKEDLVEEVLRLYGYDKVPSQMPEVVMTLPITNEERALERKLKTILSLKYSLTEAYNYSFVGEDQLNKLGIDSSGYIKLANPLSGIHNLLRQNLVPGFVDNIKTNQMISDVLGFFEIGKVFLNIPGNIDKDKTGEEKLPYQENRLGIVVAGNKGDMFMKLKSIITNLFQNVLSRNIAVEFVPATKMSWANEKVSAKVFVSGVEVGDVALVSDNVIKNFNLKKKVAIAEFRLNEILNLSKQENKRFKEAPKYPAVIRDLSFVVDKKVLYNDIRKAIQDFHDLISEVVLFDVYEGDKLDGDKKSLAFHVYFQSDDKTLTNNEVDKIQHELTVALEDKYEAKLRDF